jgi:hypothetical protein
MTVKTTKLSLTRTMDDVRDDLITTIEKIQALTDELDRIPAALRGSRKWDDRVQARAALFQKRAELLEEVRAIGRRRGLNVVA